MDVDFEGDTVSDGDHITVITNLAVELAKVMHCIYC